MSYTKETHKRDCTFCDDPFCNDYNHTCSNCAYFTTQESVDGECILKYLAVTNTKTKKTYQILMPVTKDLQCSSYLNKNV